MSYNSHQRKLLDDSVSLEHRASHARSCALHVANKLGVDREYVIELVKQKTGVSLHDPCSADGLIAAHRELEHLRRGAAVKDLGEAGGYTVCRATNARGVAEG